MSDHETEISELEMGLTPLQEKIAKIRLEKFSGESWRAFENSVKSELGKLGLLERWRDGQLPANVGTSIFYLIRGACTTDTVLNVIEGVTDGDYQQLWKRLLEEYNPCRFSNKLMWIRTLISSTCEGTDVAQWMSDQASVMSKLQGLSAGEALQASDLLVAGLLENLPTEFAAVSDALSSSGAPPTYERLRAAVLDKRGRLAADGVDDKARVMAAQGTRPYHQQQQHNQGDNRPRCMMCGKTGHYMSSCFHNPAYKGNKGQGRDQPQKGGNQDNKKGKGKKGQQKRAYARHADLSSPAI